MRTLIVWLALTFFYVPFLGAQQIKLNPDALKSVLMISSKRLPYCASGFRLTDGSVVTSAHFIASVCPNGACQDLKFAYSQAPGEKAEVELLLESPPEIEFVSYFLDAAILRLRTSDGQGGFFELQDTPNNSAEIAVMGFPACQALEIGQGKLQSKNSLRIFSSAAGQHGSSGSAFVSPELKLLGVATQSDSFWQAVKSTLFKSKFPLRGVRSDVLHQALHTNQRVAKYLRLSQEYYLSAVLPLQGSDRIWPALEYMDLINKLKFDIIQSNPDKHILANLLLLDQFPTAIAGLGAGPQNELEQSLELVVLGYMLENKGANSNLFRPLHIEGFIASLTSASRSAEHLQQIKNMLNAAQANKHPGVEMYFITRYSLLAALLLCILLPWAFSLGYVFHAQPGGFLRRVGVTTCVALLAWPISLLWFLVFRLRANKPTRLKS